MTPARPLYFLLAGALSSAGLLLLMSQAAPSSVAWPWPPPRQAIVNLRLEQPPAAPGQTGVIYTVPPDRWLTVTAFKVWGANQGYPLPVLLESFGGATAPKAGYPFDAPGPIPGTSVLAAPSAELGWTFRPGSQVLLANGSDSTYTYCELLGYETRN